MFNYHPYFSNQKIVDFRHFIAENKQNIELITSRLLLVIGIKPNLRGMAYLRDAIYYCYHLPQNAKINFSAEVFPYIAQKYNTRARNVDRDILNAIHECYDSERLFIINNLFGYDIVSPKYAPTNAEFIVQIVRWMQSLELELKE